MKLLILTVLFICLFANKLDKIQPEVLAELELNGGFTDIFIEFEEKVNFNTLAKGEKWDDIDAEKRGKLVYESLLDVATWTQAPIKSYLTERNVEFQSFYIDNLIYVKKATKRMIDYFISKEEVKRVYRNVKINLDELEKPRPAEPKTKQIEKGIAWIKAPVAWRSTKGRGIVIANSDTGVTHTHEAIKETYLGKNGNHNYHWWDGSSPRQNAPVDAHGHGTHCMGTKVGYTPDEQIGVAPEASWMTCRSLGPGASARTVLSCLQFFLAPTDLQGNNANVTLRPHVTSHSYLCNGCQLDNAVTALLRAGVEVVVAAGNSGSRCNTITEPAAYVDTLAVGALNPNADTATFFSSRGPARGTVKPQVAAPGANVRSCGRVSGYVQMSGTSMAAPHVAGAIGLLWAYKNVFKRNITKTREYLYESSKKQEDSQCGTGKAPNNVYGHGTIDLEKLFKLAQYL